MNKELLEKLEKQLEYYIREELYEEAAQVQTQIADIRRKNNKINPPFNIKSKRFIDFINEKKTNP